MRSGRAPCVPAVFRAVKPVVARRLPAVDARGYPRLMHATRACRRAALLSASSLKCYPPPSSYSLAARHIERGLFLSRCPPRLGPPILTNRSAGSSSRRNLSTSTAPRRAQYSRFDDDPNRPPSQSTGFQTRDIIICTLGAGSVIYYIFQYVMFILTSHLSCLDISPF